MTTSLDNAKERFIEILPELIALSDRASTEADTRLHVIDRMLIEVLGWPREFISTEPPTESGYIDYLVGARGTGRFVVEAKRQSTPLLATHDTRLQYYKVRGPALKPATEGIAQARRYCAEQGVMFAAVTNGREWIGLWAVRSDDVPPAEGNAATFPSFNAIERDFAAFYELFSPNGISAQLYQILIHEAEGMRAQSTEVLASPLRPNEIKMLAKPAHVLDLQHVFWTCPALVDG